MTTAAERIAGEAWSTGWKRDPDLTVSECADRYRWVSSGSEPGQWRTDRTPYLREIMDSLGPQCPAERVIFMKGSRLGATEAGNNWLLYVAKVTPAETLMVLPRTDDAKKASKKRLAPMIRDTPALRDLIVENRSRDSGNTLFRKEFPGGAWDLTGANSAAGFRADTYRFLFGDEIDGWPEDVDGEGDPLALAETRTTTYNRRRKHYFPSTPTIKTRSRIEREFMLGDQRRYFVPCIHCGHMDWIRWEQIRFDHDPNNPVLQCAKCDGLIEERWKPLMFERAEWRPTAEGDGVTISFHLSGLYSPLGWLSWRRIVSEFIAKKNDPSQLKVWVNQRLGETWEERGEGADAEPILARVKRYPAEVPNGVGVLTCGIDTHGDRLECVVKGWGAGEESWLIAIHDIHGDPKIEDGQKFMGPVWRELDEFLRTKFTHESGQTMRIECTAIDSGGHHSEEVYRYCKARLGWRVFAVRGGNLTGLPVVGPFSKNNAYRTRLFTLCTDTAKKIIYTRLKILNPGPGYMHFPEGPTDLEYVKQLTSHKGILKWFKGRSRMIWDRVFPRDHRLDEEVYALAALYILGEPVIRGLAQRAANRSVKAEKPPDDPEAPPTPPAPPPSTSPVTNYGLGPRIGRGFVKGWRR